MSLWHLSGILSLKHHRQPGARLLVPSWASDLGQTGRLEKSSGGGRIALHHKTRRDKIN